MASASSWSCVTMIGGDAEPALQRLDLVAQAHAHARIERRQRLVEQQQRRRGARARGPAPRAAAGRPRAGPDTWRLLGQADERQQLGHARRDLGLRLAAVDEAVADVVRHGQVGEQRVGLEDDAEVALRGRQPRDIAAADLDRARRPATSRPAITRSSVVLPQPEGPRKQTSLPLSTSSETSSSAVNAPKRLVMPDAEVHGASGACATPRGCDER